MLNMLEEIFKTLPTVISVVTPAIIVVGWFVRIEVRSKNNHDDIRSIQIRLESLEQTKLDLSERMAGLSERIARLETKLDLILDEIKKRG